MSFLYAAGFNSAKDGLRSQNVHIQLAYDVRNKSLANLKAPAADLMAKSMYESYFQVGAEDRAEGPFSRDGCFYMGTKLVQPGRREELAEFSDQARQMAKFTVRLSLPHLNLILPSHDFLEVLYNRFANDLALWQLKAPVFNVSSFACFGWYLNV